MAKKQVCIRTFPNGYTTTTEDLTKYLEKGYIVVMCNRFIAKSPDVYGNEYILEKEDADNG